MNKNKYLLGVFLIIFGVILLLGSFGFMNLSIWDIIGTWWPLFVIFYGIKEIIENNKHGITSGSIWLLVGILLQANQLEMLPFGFWATFWPLLLILVGVLTIIKRNNNNANMFKAVENDIFTEDFIEVNAMFSGVDRYVESKNFQGANINSVFSGVKLDLRDAVIQNDFKGIDVGVTFAGVEILVPFNWQIVSKGSPVFGGFEDKTRTSNTDLENKKIVNVTYNVAFGGLVIRN